MKIGPNSKPINVLTSSIVIQVPTRVYSFTKYNVYVSYSIFSERYTYSPCFYTVLNRLPCNLVSIVHTNSRTFHSCKHGQVLRKHLLNAC